MVNLLARALGRIGSFFENWVARHTLRSFSEDWGGPYCPCCYVTVGHGLGHHRCDCRICRKQEWRKPSSRRAR